MKKWLRGVASAVMCLGLLASGTGVDKVGAVSQNDNGGGGKKKVINIYIHGFVGKSDSLSPVIRYITDAKEKYLTHEEVVKLCDLKGTKMYCRKVGTEYIVYSGQKYTFIMADDDVYPLTEKFDYKQKYNKSGFVPDKRSGIQFIFNGDSQSLAEQVKYINNGIMNSVPSDYQVNLIGHSMGGLAAIAYATKHGGNIKGTNLPKINKIVTIASPLNGSVWSKPKIVDDLTKNWTDVFGEALRDLKPNSEAIKEVHNNIGKINGKTEVYSLAGNKYNLVGDGAVNVSSALYLANKDFKKKAKFTFSVKTGTFNEGHMSIKENKKALASIKSFLAN